MRFSDSHMYSILTLFSWLLLLHGAAAHGQPRETDKSLAQAKANLFWIISSVFL